MKPLFNNVVIQPDPPKKEVGGIIIGHSAQEQPVEGEVVMCGEGKWQAGTFIPISVKVGQKVKYHKSAGSPIEIDGKKYLIMLEDSIIGII